MKPSLLALLLLAGGPLLAQEAAPTPEATPDVAPEATPEAPSAATRTFQPPAGCEVFVTVQMAACSVSHHFTCERDPEGWQRRVDMDEGGITYFGAIDAETQWVESYHVLSEHTERLGAAPDPASFTELLETGRDSFDFVTESPEVGQTRYVGSDRLTGETVTIDGVELERTEYQIVASTPDGTEAWRGAGREYISREWRMFLSGESTYTSEGETNEVDDAPVEFIFPGERGFLSVSPKHGCGAVMSRWEPEASLVVPEGQR
jgi:hypothetical protein